MSKHNHPTTSKTIRFPANIAKQAKTACTQQGKTFTAFVLQAVRLALEDLKEAENSLP